jgi:hypothetical protein
MTRPILAPAILLALLSGACAAHRSSTSSASASPASGAQAGSAKGSGSQIVCRTERPTGSNIMKRVCFSEDELDAAAAAAQDDHRRAIQKASVQPRHD